MAVSMAEKSEIRKEHLLVYQMECSKAAMRVETTETPKVEQTAPSKAVLLVVSMGTKSAVLKVSSSELRTVELWVQPSVPSLAL